MKMKYLSIGIACIVLSGMYFIFFHKSDSVQSHIDNIKKGGAVPPVHTFFKAFEADSELKAILHADFNMQDVVQFFRDRYGKTIHHKHTQAKLVEKLKSYLISMYPDDWVVYLYAMLREIFPGMENEIFDTFEKLHRYNTWLEENKAQLKQMDGNDRRNALWDMRYEIFGQDAEQVWETDKRNEPVFAALETIQAGDMTFEEKLSLYQGSIQEAYKSDSQSFIALRKQELMNAFLDAGSVQNNLAEMTPQERKDSLTQLRKAMGLDNAALQRWEELDRVRDERWDAGRQYMNERAELQKRYKGPEYEKQLDSLRMKYFGGEASTIKAEEESGYFRFQQQRKYGLE